MKKLIVLIAIVAGLFSQKVMADETMIDALASDTYYSWNVKVTSVGGGKVYLKNSQSPSQATSSLTLKGVKKNISSLSVCGAPNTGKELTGYEVKDGNDKGVKYAFDNEFRVRFNGSAKEDSLSAATTMNGLTVCNVEALFGSVGVGLGNDMKSYMGGAKLDNLTNKVGDKVTVTATPGSGYEFTYWSDNKNGTTKISTKAVYTFTVKKSMRLYAFFRKKS